MLACVTPAKETVSYTDAELTASDMLTAGSNGAIDEVRIQDTHVRSTRAGVRALKGT